MARLYAVVVLVLCQVVPAAAERFRILDGEVRDEATGQRAVLAGDLELELAETPFFIVTLEGADHFDAPTFDFRAGGERFAPEVPHVFEGLTAGFPTIFRLPDGIELIGDRIASFRLAAGGDVVASGEGTVTFRDWSFFGDEGVAFDRAASDGAPPVRFEAKGTLTATDTTYRIQRDPCPPMIILPAPVMIPPILPPPSGGATITIGGGADASVLLDSGTIQIANPGGATLVVSDTEDLRRDAGVAVARVPQVIPLDLTLVPTVGVTLTAVSLVTIPFDLTLEDLGISVPDGATLTIEANGHVTVESAGALEINTGLLDIEGLTLLTIVSAVEITVGPLGIQLAPGVGLELRSGAIGIPNDAPIRIGSSCPGLLRIGSQQVVTQSFALVAAVERPVEVQLLGRRHKRVHPAFRRRVELAILGSEDIDVRDIDALSLRLGPDAVPPARRGRRPRHRDVNRDGIDDLVVRFGASGIALGDSEVCLTGATFHGPAIAGCGAVEAAKRAPRHVRLPKRSGRHRGRHHR